MSDIRLKKITVEPNSILEIQRGSLKISDTKGSSSTSASVMLNGGMSINIVNNSTSHTNGGALTVAGGVGISKNIYINGDQINENPMSIIRVLGGSVDRLNIGSIVERRISMSADGSSNQIEIYPDSININTTTKSSNASTGALVVSGGVSSDQIHIETTSFLKGDTRVGSELRVGGNTRIESGVIILDHTPSTSSIIYNADNDINILNDDGDVNLGSADTGIVNINNTVHIGYEDVDIYKNTIFNNTQESLSVDSAGIITKCGISINNTVDSTSSTQGGGITIAGGASIKRNVFIGEGLNMIESTLSNKIYFYNTTSGLGNSGENILINSGSTLSNVIIRTDRDIFQISGNSDVLLHGDASQTYRMNIDNKEFYIQGRSAAEPATLSLYTNDGDSNDDARIKVYKSGIPKMRETSEYLESGWNASMGHFEMNVSRTGSGEMQRLVINKDRLIFESNGNNTINGVLNINNYTYINDNVEIENDGYIRGQMFITNTTETNLLSGGALVVTGDISTNGKILTKNGIRIFNETRNEISAHRISNYDQFEYSTDTPDTDINSVIYAKSNTMNYNNEFKIYTFGKPYDTSSEFIQISNKNSDVHTLLSNRNGGGRLRDLNLKAGSSQIHLGTGGNVGINTTSANYTLDISGNMNVGGRFEVSNGFVNTDSLVRMMHTEGSTGITSGSLIVSGGVTINGGINAASSTSGGALTVMGGVGVLNDILIGGRIETHSEEYNKMRRLELVSTDISHGLTSGSLICGGGISIKATTNSLSPDNGGGLTIAGGVGIGGDTWMSGDINLLSNINLYSTSGELINFYDQFNIRRFIISGGDDDFKIKTTNNIGVPDEDTFVIDKISKQSYFKNITSSLDASTASVILSGGISINCTENATSSTSGGGVSIAGGLGIAKDVYISGISRFMNTEETFNLETGSVMMHGGVVIKKSLNIGGDAIITGDLTVHGKTTSVESTVVDIKDNIIQLNSGPQGTKDGGISINRYQIDNDDADGDVVNDVIAETIILQDQTGISNMEVRFSPSASALDDYYKGYWIKVGSGFAVRQVRQIVSYNGTTKIAVISSEWTGANPSIGDVIYLYNRYYVGIIFNEVDDRFKFGATSIEPITSGSLELTTLVGVEMLDLIVERNVTTDQLRVVSTENSTSDTTGSLVVSGGMGVSKDVYISGDLYVKNNDITPNTDDIVRPRMYSIDNNITSPMEISDVTFVNSWGVDIYLTSRITTSTRVYYTNYHIRGVSKDDEWDVVKTYVGDAINIDFGISPSGTLVYTTPDIADFISGEIKLRCITV